MGQRPPADGAELLCESCTVRLCWTVGATFTGVCASELGSMEAPAALAAPLPPPASSFSRSASWFFSAKDGSATNTLKCLVSVVHLTQHFYSTCGSEPQVI